tara:strand:+ start:5130 stop:5672 length:543 start_codon:yes stop_codon:yes gene_type:complete
MNQLALKNINTLLNIDKETLFIFNNKEITINTDESTEHVNENNVNTEYALYFTFNHLLNLSRSNRELANVLNIALDNLYENESFIKVLENDTNLEEIMDDISIKLDFILERYNNFRICNRFFYTLHSYLNIRWDELMEVVLKGLPHFRKVDNDDDSGDESDESEEGVESSDDEVERCKED